MGRGGWTTGKMWNGLLEETLGGEGGLQERGIGNRRNYDQNTDLKHILGSAYGLRVFK